LRADRITLLAAGLDAGGTQRVLVMMADYWVANGRKVRVVTLSSTSSDFYGLDPRVERVGLDLIRPSSGVWGALKANANRLKALRRAVLAGQPDCVISFGDTVNCLALLAIRGTNVKLIVSERNDPRRLPIGRSWAILRRLLYPRAHAVVVQTDRVVPWARQFIQANRVRVIPNSVRVPSLRASLASRPNAARQMVALGRLDDQKGFDLLISAFARCAPDHPDWSLVIAGEGARRRELEAQVAEADLEDRVRLPGSVQDTESLLAASDLFVLSSRFEGFPNVLLEAMAVGLPTIAFDCDSGPAEIIRTDIDGVLVPAGEVDRLVQEMNRLMGDDSERVRLGREAEAVTRRFSLTRIMQLWESVADGPASARPATASDARSGPG
jgi:glycosyltransferase involved in cell wall biosynthesis